MTSNKALNRIAIVVLVSLVLLLVPLSATSLGAPAAGSHSAAPASVASSVSSTSIASHSMPSSSAFSSPTTSALSSSHVSRFQSPPPSVLGLPKGTPIDATSASQPASGTVSLDYASAAPLVISAAAGYRGTSWQVSLGAGIAIPTTYTINITNATFAGTCGFSFIGTPPSSLTVSGTPSSAASGTAAFYEFYLSAPALPGVMVFAFVDSGTATLLYQQTSSPTCLVFGSSAGAIPSNVIDSPTALAYVNAAGGSAFLAANPGAEQEWAVYGGGYSLSSNGTWYSSPPIWEVIYGSGGCSFFRGPAQSSPGHEFFGEVEGLTGAVLGTSTGNCSTVTYPLTFTETGLPSGTSWSVELNGWNTSTTSTIGFDVGNGTWYYSVPNVAGYTPASTGGSVIVNGTAANVTVAFTPSTTQNVTFTGSGLVSGAAWYVSMTDLSNFSSVTLSANGNVSVNFNETPGLYSYNVGAPSAYSATPSSGSITVSVSPVAVPIVFVRAPTYLASFNESGLPAGTLWGVYVSGFANGTFYNSEVLSTNSTVSTSLPNGTFSFEAGSVLIQYGPSPYAGSITVNGASVQTPIAFSHRGAYSVRFTETGLPTGTPWYVEYPVYVQLNSSTTNEIGFLGVNGSAGFDVGGATGYVATPASGIVVLNGTSVVQPIVFVPTGTTYAVTFNETGLPSGTAWSVSLNNIPLSNTSSAIGFRIGNGTFPYSVGPVVGYASSPSSGTVTVNGTAVNVTIAFSVGYEVTFHETGLVSGTNWSVTLHSVTVSSTTSSISFFEANGSYVFSVATVSGYSASPSAGSVQVAGALVVENITFTPGAQSSWSVTFLETGLPSGTNWSVTLGTSVQWSITPTIVFTEANGSYGYSVGIVVGSTASPASGTVTVNGAVVLTTIAFTTLPAGEFSVVFTETGLPSGTSWSVTIGSQSVSSIAASLAFAERNGSYSFTVGAVSGYLSTPSAGTVNVTGRATSTPVKFTVTSSSSSGGTFLGLPGMDGYLLIGLIAVLLIAGIAAAMMRSRRKKGGAPPQAWSGPTAPAEGSPAVAPPPSGGPPPGAQ